MTIYMPSRQHCRQKRLNESADKLKNPGALIKLLINLSVTRESSLSLANDRAQYSAFHVFHFPTFHQRDGDKQTDTQTEGAHTFISSIEND